MIQLPDMPASVERLPKDHRGYPVPFFVTWLDEDGKLLPLDKQHEGQPEFRLADARKFRLCHIKKLCWVCGESLDERQRTFVIGPMCAINRISAEMPCHIECARFSVQACPFLSRPKAVRRTVGLPEDIEDRSGHDPDNPGVAMLWNCRRYDLVQTDGGWLVELGNPAWVQWWAEGRRATPQEAFEALQHGALKLHKIAAECGKADVAKLEGLVGKAMRFLPGEWRPLYGESPLAKAMPDVKFLSHAKRF